MTNDWELYGEGSGDFYSIQEARLKSMLEVMEKYEARLTVFAEVGQQWAHLRDSDLRSRQVAKHWEASLRETIVRGHDVQLHYHPTWKDAIRQEGRWRLDLRHWSAASLGPESLTQDLCEGREYLESLLKPKRSAYSCVAFRAGAFALQPFAVTLPALARAGFLCDSSVVPGYWDLLHFDYRDLAVHPPGPIWMEESGARLLELPVHTEVAWDMPGLRRLFPQRLFHRMRYGLSRDREYEAWAIARDQALQDNCVVLDPLEQERRRARFSLSQLPSYFLRKSAAVLDYDFMPPHLFSRHVARAYDTAAAAGLDGDIPIVALGHANNGHTAENLERTLRALKEEMGDRLVFRTIQETVQRLAISAAGTDTRQIELVRAPL